MLVVHHIATRRLVDGPAGPRPLRGLRRPVRGEAPAGRRCRCSTRTTRCGSGNCSAPRTIRRACCPSRSAYWRRGSGRAPGRAGAADATGRVRRWPAIAGTRPVPVVPRRRAPAAGRARPRPGRDAVHGAAGRAGGRRCPGSARDRHPPRHRRSPAAPTRRWTTWSASSSTPWCCAPTSPATRPSPNCWPGSGRRPGRVRPPGRAVRAPGGGAQPGPLAGPPPAVPGDADAAEHRRPGCWNCRAAASAAADRRLGGRASTWTSPSARSSTPTARPTGLRYRRSTASRPICSTGDRRDARASAGPGADGGGRRPGAAGRPGRRAGRAPSGVRCCREWNDTAAEVPSDGARGAVRGPGGAVPGCRRGDRRGLALSPTASWTRGRTVLAQHWSGRASDPECAGRAVPAALGSTWSSALLAVLKAGGGLPAAGPGVPGGAARTLDARRRRPGAACCTTR